MQHRQASGVRAFAKTAAGAAVAGVVLAPSAGAAQTLAASVSELEVLGARTLDSPKMTAPLLDTPRQVTVISQAVIDQTGSTSLAEVLRTVPGITMAMGEGGQPFGDRPLIRGFESASGITIDGLRDSGSQSRELFALESVEVVKGASGAYSGRGASGGSINLVSKTAKADDFLAGDATLGTAGLGRITADGNIRLGAEVAARVSAMWQSARVPGRDAVTDDRWGVAPTVTFGLTGPTRAVLGYYHYESDGVMDYGHPYDPATGAPVRVDRDNFYGLVDRDFHKTRSDLATAELSHDLTSDLHLRGVLRYGDTLNDYIASNPDDSQGNVPKGLVFRNTKSRRANTRSLIGQVDLSGSLATGPVAHSFALGLEAGREKTRAQSYSVDLTAPGGVAIPRGGCNLFGSGAPSGYNCTDLFVPTPNDPWTGAITLNAPTDTRVDTKSAYLFDTVGLGERWQLNLGLRYDDFSTETSTALGNESDFLTWQAGLVFKPNAASSLYASVGTSANPSGATAGDGSDNISTSNEDLKPEKLTNYELGAKWAPRPGFLVSAAVFRNQKTNAHVSAGAGRGAPQVAIGEVRVDGLELSVSGELRRGWSVFGGYTWLDGKIVDDGPAASNDGARVPNTPEHSVSLWTTVSVLPRLTLGGGATYMSNVYGDPANTRYVPAYWRFDAVATFAVSEAVQLRLNLKNLTDATYYDRAYTTHMATVAPGRSASLTVAARF